MNSFSLYPAYPLKSSCRAAYSLPVANYKLLTGFAELLDATATRLSAKGNLLYILQNVASTLPAMHWTYQGKSCTDQATACTHQVITCTRRGKACTHQGITCTDKGMACTHQGMTCTSSHRWFSSLFKEKRAIQHQARSVQKLPQALQQWLWTVLTASQIIQALPRCFHQIIHQSLSNK